ncbi:hypothetical protein BHS10_00001 [Gardnerella vaginalis]|nr:hypothetical protein BHS10_00001 [Gardnerella vaginalis]
MQLSSLHSLNSLSLISSLHMNARNNRLCFRLGWLWSWSWGALSLSKSSLSFLQLIISISLLSLSFEKLSTGNSIAYFSSQITLSSSINCFSRTIKGLGTSIIFVIISSLLSSFKSSLILSNLYIKLSLLNTILLSISLSLVRSISLNCRIILVCNSFLSIVLSDRLIIISLSIFSIITSLGCLTISILNSLLKLSELSSISWLALFLLRSLWLSSECWSGECHTGEEGGASSESGDNLLIHHFNFLSSSPPC